MSAATACALLAAVAASVMVVPGSAAGAPEARPFAEEDSFLAGYATAVLEREFGLENVDLRVTGGLLELDPDALGDADPEAVRATLAGIRGLRVELAAPGEPVAPAAPPQAPEVVAGTGFLPNRPLFDELIADPRWPRFSASLQGYGDDSELDVVFNGNFGATLPVYGFEAAGGLFQVGVQGGVFSIFDLNSDSFDLINSDFIAAIPFTARFGPWSAQARLFHQSSHLGDEFLLRSRTDRINLSFEGLDALLSLDLPGEVLRLYGGGGVLVHSDPDLDPLSVQAGIEASSPQSVLGDVLFPIAAFDIQSSEETDWQGDYSVRAGVEIRAGLLAERRLQLLLEYFNGRSPNGQFFERDLEYVGTGLYYFF
jgi:Protein of unknown function (DUF1207)